MTPTEATACQLLALLREQDLVDEYTRQGGRWTRGYRDAPSTSMVGGDEVPDLEAAASAGVLVAMLPWGWSMHPAVGGSVLLLVSVGGDSRERARFNGPYLGVAAAKALIALHGGSDDRS